MRNTREFDNTDATPAATTPDFTDIIDRAAALQQQGRTRGLDAPIIAALVLGDLIGDQVHRALDRHAIDLHNTLNHLTSELAGMVRQ